MPKQNNDHLTKRLICRINDIIVFCDYRGRKIELSDLSWEHIQERHPEVSLEEIHDALADPMGIRECREKSSVERYHLIKTEVPKRRYRVVVVKFLAEGNFISTALTVTALKPGKTLYKKEHK